MNKTSPQGKTLLPRQTRTLLKIGISAALLTLLLTHVEIMQLRNSLAAYRWATLIGALFLLVLGTMLAALRWWILLPEVLYKRLLRYSFVGQFYALVLPGQLAGEAIKAWRISRGRADGPRIAASVIVDRLVGVIALLLLGLFGLSFSDQELASRLLPIFVVATLGLLSFLFVASSQSLGMLAMRTLRTISIRFPRTFSLVDLFATFLASWRGYLAQPLRLLSSLLLGILFQATVVLIYMLLATDMGINVSGFDWMWIVGVTSLAVLLPVSIAGIGLREGALVGCLAVLSVSTESSIALSIGVLAVVLAGALIGAALEVAESTSTSNA
jgi:uncharacterized protein (TIRG00374 family)